MVGAAASTSTLVVIPGAAYRPGVWRGSDGQSQGSLDVNEGGTGGMTIQGPPVGLRAAALLEVAAAAELTEPTVPGDGKGAAS